MAEKIGKVVREVMNSNAVVTTFLGVTFGLIGVRSDQQQKRIEALEEEKDCLMKDNKCMKWKMWEWKQQLFAEAAAAASSAVVPLPTLKAIYGEYTIPSGEKGKESSPRIMI